MSARSWSAFGAGEFYAPNAPAFASYVMRSLVVIVAAGALSVRSLSASVASPTEWKSAHITKARHRFDCGDVASAIGSEMKTYQYSQNVLCILLRRRNNVSHLWKTNRTDGWIFKSQSEETAAIM